MGSLHVETTVGKTVGVLSPPQSVDYGSSEVKHL